MIGKRLAACLLTGMLFFGTGADVMARHAAEERGEQRRMERAERLERERIALEEERAAARRIEERAEKERAEREALEIERAREEARAAEEREKARREAEAKEAEEQRLAEERAAEEKQKQEELAAREAEARRIERERAEAEARIMAESERAAEEKIKASETNKEGSGTGVLEKYLNRKKESASTDVEGKKKQEAKPVTYLSKQEMELTPLKTDTLDVGGTLLFSDSPEYVTQPGILYSDVIQGDARVLYYHVNQIPTACKVAVVLENTSDRYAVIHITRGGCSAPDRDYLKVGRETQRQYFFEKQSQNAIYLDGYQSRVMLESMDKTLVLNEQLVYGVYDFSSTGPVRVTVILYPSSADPLEFVKSAPVLPKDEHRLRGTFTGMDRLLKAHGRYNPGDGEVYITIGNEVDDKFKQGIDATDGSLVENTGNYGVMYHLEVPMKGRKKVQLWANPLGGFYTGAVHVSTEEPAGAWTCMVPKDAPFFGDADAPITLPNKDGSLLLPKGTEMFSLGTFKGETLHVEFTPPGASNLPVRFILSEP